MAARGCYGGKTSGQESQDLCNSWSYNWNYNLCASFNFVFHHITFKTWNLDKISYSDLKIERL